MRPIMYMSAVERLAERQLDLDNIDGAIGHDDACGLGSVPCPVSDEHSPSLDLSWNPSYQKNPHGAVTGATTTIKHVVPCCFTVCTHPVHCNAAEYDDLGTVLLLGKGHSDWDRTTAVHKQGLMCLKDRLSYQETCPSQAWSLLGQGHPGSAEHLKAVGWRERWLAVQRPASKHMADEL